MTDDALWRRRFQLFLAIRLFGLLTFVLGLAIAFTPERHTLLIVSAGTVIGMPALAAACRAVIWPWPAWSTWPITT